MDKIIILVEQMECRGIRPQKFMMKAIIGGSASVAGESQENKNKNEMTESNW